MPDRLTEVPYVEIAPDRPVERFLRMFILSPRRIDELVLISPIIGMLHGVSVSMTRILDRINREHIRTYVITNEPNPDYPSHVEAVANLSKSDYTEIRFNESLHAKVYVCRFTDGGFALLGSGNLTETSIRQRIEIGLIIFSRGRGVPLFHELSEWGTIRLRSLRESKLVKRMKPRRW
jgi:hypothetical protein